MSGILVVQDIFDDYFLMEILDFIGNIGGMGWGSACGKPDITKTKRPISYNIFFEYQSRNNKVKLFLVNNGG